MGAVMLVSQLYFAAKGNCVQSDLETQLLFSGWTGISQTFRVAKKKKKNSHLSNKNIAPIRIIIEIV
jgi:hypothetical protein